ncbi:MAG: 3-dehydroquinate synthase [Mariniblastus sp.]|nr:3-dehydroquinate synthase [Mariniblastus sp.]
MPTLVPVELPSNPYTIHIEVGVLEALSQHLPACPHALVISDTQVGELYQEAVCQDLKQTVQRVDSIQIPTGEASKSVEQAQQLWDQLVDLGTNRSSVVVALGGGVVGDLAGFVAATFARGISLIQIPTSLLAQVDSSVGGKVGINLAEAKNMVGAFWQPDQVLIDPGVLKTLDERNYTSGLAEVVKYGVIMDEAFLEFLENRVAAIYSRDPDLLAEMIARCCQLKAEVVVEDEREISGRRAILNYGHTFGHAIETVYGYGTYLHGEAISIGMQMAVELAADIGFVEDDLKLRQRQLLEDLNLPVRLPDDRRPDLLEAMQNDKKVEAGQLRLVLPKRAGLVELVAAPDEEKILASMARSTGSG